MGGTTIPATPSTSSASSTARHVARLPERVGLHKHVTASSYALGLGQPSAPCPTVPTTGGGHWALGWALVSLAPALSGWTV